MSPASRVSGKIATEPALLNDVELGPTPESTLLASVLFDAQLGHFERTGELKSVSEAPLHVEPWFAYFGLRLDAPADRKWALLPPRISDFEPDEAFLRDFELVSSKSAYLWAAAYPHFYSDRLLHHVRQRARIEDVGFSVGVFTRTGEAMPGYSDLNTNGVILSAISAMLTGIAPWQDE